MKRQRLFTCPYTGEDRVCEKCRTCASFSHFMEKGGKPVCFEGVNQHKIGKHQRKFEIDIATGNENTMASVYISIRREPATPVDKCAEDDMRNIVSKVLGTLPEREQAVIRMRFGLVDGVCHTLGEIADVFNVSRERIRTIEQKALRRLRHPVRLRKLAEVSGLSITPDEAVTRSIRREKDRMEKLERERQERIRYFMRCRGLFA